MSTKPSNNTPLNLRAHAIAGTADSPTTSFAGISFHARYVKLTHLAPSSCPGSRRSRSSARAWGGCAGYQPRSGGRGGAREVQTGLRQ